MEPSMRKLLTFLIALAASIVSSIAVAHTDGIYNPTANSIGNFEGIDNPKASAAGGAASYTFAGSADNNGGVGNVWTTSTINIGPTVASRLVVLCLEIQNNPTLTITVNGVSATQATVDASSNQVSVWYASVPSGSGAATIVVTGGNFFTETMLVYYASGLVSNTPRTATHAAGGVSGTLSVVAGDFIFAAASAASGITVTWGTSTQSPTATQSDITQTAFPGFSADWNVLSTNAAFSIIVGGTGSNFAAANWR
jgi:hypothetical protein